MFYNQDLGAIKTYQTPSRFPLSEYNQRSHQSYANSSEAVAPRRFIWCVWNRKSKYEPHCRRGSAPVWPATYRSYATRRHWAACQTDRRARQTQTGARQPTQIMIVSTYVEVSAALALNPRGVLCTNTHSYHSCIRPRLCFMPWLGVIVSLERSRCNVNWLITIHAR
jgi:hypothetical protein